MTKTESSSLITDKALDVLHGLLSELSDVVYAIAEAQARERTLMAQGVVLIEAEDVRWAGRAIEECLRSVRFN